MEALDSLNSELRTMQFNIVAKLINSRPLPVVKEKYKVLGEFHIPLDESKIQALLRDLQLLKNDCPAHALFDVPSWENGKASKRRIPSWKPLIASIVNSVQCDPIKLQS